MKKKTKVKKKVVKRKKKVLRKVKKKAAKPRKKKKVLQRKKQKSAEAKAKVAVSASIPAGASLEEIGVVTHYFPHVEAAVVKMTKGTLAVGDTIIIKGHTTDFLEEMDSMQLDHVAISSAAPGQEIGLKVKSKVREHDIVYKVIK